MLDDAMLDDAVLDDAMLDDAMLAVVMDDAVLDHLGGVALMPAGDAPACASGIFHGRNEIPHRAVPDDDVGGDVGDHVARRDRGPRRTAPFHAAPGVGAARHVANDDEPRGHRERVAIADRRATGHGGECRRRAGGHPTAAVPHVAARPGRIHEQGQAQQCHEQGVQPPTHRSPRTRSSSHAAAGFAPPPVPFKPLMLIGRLAARKRGVFAGGGAKKAKGRGRKSCHGLSVIRACQPPASGV